MDSDRRSLLAGIWESDAGCLTLLDYGDRMLIHQRSHTESGPLEQSMLLPTDGSATKVGQGLFTATVTEGLRIEAEIAGRKLSVFRVVVGEELLETVQIDELSETTTYRRSATKQVLVYRRDLKMRKGKIAAQCAHGAMAVFFRRDRKMAGKLVIPLDGPMEHWSRKGFAKIVLSVENEADLLEIHRLAVAAGLPTAIITDAGRTEFHGVPTRTMVAIGPAALGEIDRITGPEGAVACKLA